MNKLTTYASQTMLVALSFMHGVCVAATGDVSFRVANKTIHLNTTNLTSAMDVSFQIEGAANVPATGWGMIVNIAPQAGATGTVRFNPPSIVNNQPNLMPASQNPFIDFDRDFVGKSYGVLGQSATQLRAFSYYVQPVLGPAPSLDANGNLSLATGRGLLSLPLIASADAAGQFIVTFDPDPVVTGITFATGMPAPQDVGIHPAGTHTAGVLSVFNPAGDYNRNGVVDTADYVLWRDTLGQTGTGLAADGNNSGTIDSGDYDLWRAHFGQTAGSGSDASVNAVVPEPATQLLLIVGILAIRSRRRITISKLIDA